MRPQPEGRGELPSDRLTSGTLLVLQCGHSPKAVENSDRVRPGRHARRGASMRPQPEGRGEPDTKSTYMQLTK